MLSLIIILIFSLGVSFFALQNTFVAPITFFNYRLPNVPLYIIVIASIVTGVIMSSVISGMNSLGYFMRIRKKDGTINQERRTISSLRDEVKKLEAENSKLRMENKDRKDAEASSDTPKNIRLRSPLAIR